jgi:hypothetical protein
MSAIPREWLQMMQFQIARFAAAQATRVDIRAARTVSLIHLAPHRCGDVSATRALLARCFGWGFAAFGGFDALARSFA